MNRKNIIYISLFFVLAFVVFFSGVKSANAGSDALPYAGVQCLGGDSYQTCGPIYNFFPGNNYTSASVIYTIRGNRQQDDSFISETVCLLSGSGGYCGYLNCVAADCGNKTTNTTYTIASGVLNLDNTMPGVPPTGSYYVAYTGALRHAYIEIPSTGNATYSDTCTNPAASNYGQSGNCVITSGPNSATLNFHVHANCSAENIPGATVAIGQDYGGGTTAITDSSGNATIPVSSNQSISWASSASGYGSAIGSVTSGSAATAVDVTLPRDCATPQPPPPPPPPPPINSGVCADDATATVTSGPTSLAPGATGSFVVHVVNSGNDKWYNGNAYKMAQNSNLTISSTAPSNVTNLNYGHLPYIMYPGDSVDWTFNVTAPTTPGTYNFQMQMDHLAFTNYLQQDNTQCSTPATPNNDVPFGGVAAKAFTVGSAAVTTNVTLSAPNVKADGATQYNIIVTGTDNLGAANLGHLDAIVNYQGTNGGQATSDPTKGRGAVKWTPNLNGNGYQPSFYKNAVACSGAGGYGYLWNTWGVGYMNLISCSSIDGINSRSVVYTVTFDPSFTAPTTLNDISGFAEDEPSTVSTGWTNFDINFGLISNMSGTLTPSTPSCTIPIGQTGCNIPFSWNTVNPVATSSITRPVNVTISSGNAASNVPFFVKYNSETFYLYNNSVLLAQSTVTSSCVAGAAWNGSTCVAAVAPAGWIKCNGASTVCSIAYGGSGTITWGSTNADSCTVSPTGWNGTQNSSGNSTGALTASKIYDLSCHGYDDTIFRASVTVAVGTDSSGTCLNGATNPPLCTTNTNGACINGAINPPTCDQFKKKPIVTEDPSQVGQ